MFARESTFIIAELSANHNGRVERAEALVRAAADAGADAVKLQTYTADTMTIPCDSEWFRIKGTLWEGRTLYELYQEAAMPWEWQPRLKALANGLGMECFSTPFDATAVDFLETMDVPCYKVASFEVVDIPLLKKIASTGKPVIMSTGMACLAEIDEAVTTLRENGRRRRPTCAPSRIWPRRSPAWRVFRIILWAALWRWQPWRLARASSRSIVPSLAPMAALTAPSAWSRTNSGKWCGTSAPLTRHWEPFATT